MKSLKFLHTLLIALTFSLVFTSCNDDDDNPEVIPQLNIVGTALQVPELSSLVAALQAADGNLVEALAGGPFTVFAPTNNAFDAFLAANNFSSLDQIRHEKTWDWKFLATFNCMGNLSQLLNFRSNQTSIN